MEILFILIIVAIIFPASIKRESSTTGCPNISFGGVITYPDDLSCEHCGNEEFVYMRDIDSSTWDMKCPKCKEIAYKHPKREERQRQIKDMLDW